MITISNFLRAKETIRQYYSEKEESIKNDKIILDHESANIRIDQTDLMSRTIVSLSRYGIHTIGELASFINENGKPTLFIIRNIGSKGIHQIMDLIYRYQK